MYVQDDRFVMIIKLSTVIPIEDSVSNWLRSLNRNTKQITRKEEDGRPFANAHSRAKNPRFARLENSQIALAPELFAFRYPVGGGKLCRPSSLGSIDHRRC